MRHGRSPKGERIKLRHAVTDELAAYKLAQLPFPGVFGVIYQNNRPTRIEPAGSGARWTGSPEGERRAERVNALEKKWVDSTREKLGQPTDLQLLQKTFDRMK
ncbi:MAG: hypothetical protein H0X73_01680 [Chthoniobacterales bacterium]|nr:hypothetical protein [Chthoniobacterales bacterium]